MAAKSITCVLLAVALLVSATCATGFKPAGVSVMSSPKLPLRARQPGGFRPTPPAGRRPREVLKYRGGFTMSAGAMTVFTEQVAPTLGTLIANTMFLSTMPAIRAARRDSDFGELNAVPFAMTVGNCVSWLSYSFIIANPYVFWSNAPGLLLGLFYTMTAVRLAKPAARKTLEVLLLVIFAINVTAGFASSMVITDFATRQLLWGLVANGILICYYASPLSTLWSVIKQRNAASIYPPLSMLNTLNGALWTTYGLAVKDMFVWAPNFIGACLGCIQLLFCLLFPRKTKQ